MVEGDFYYQRRKKILFYDGERSLVNLLADDGSDQGPESIQAMNV